MSISYTVQEASLHDEKIPNSCDERGEILGRFQCNITGKGVNIYRRNRDGLLCAMKRFSLNQSDSFEREITALKLCGSHSNVIEVLDFYQDPTDGCLILCETLASGGTLTGLLTEIGRPMTEVEVFFYACELFETVNFIHERGILHHDIKEENVFIQADGHLILGDFGLARQLAIGCSQPNTWSNQSAHMPFEVHSDIINYPQGGFKFRITHSVDWFSVGVLIYVLLRCQLPFNKPLILENAPFSICFPTDTCSLLKDLLRGLLRTHPNKRLGGCNLFSHPWILNNTIAKDKIDANGIDGFRKFIRDKHLTVPFLPTTFSFKQQ